MSRFGRYCYYQRAHCGAAFAYGLNEKSGEQTVLIYELDTRIGMIPFADKANCEVSPTEDFHKIKRTIDKLDIGDRYGYGNSAHPLDLGYRELQKRPVDVKYMVVLTDGMWGCCDAAISAAQKCHKAGIEVMALGFGTADHAFLKKIASTDAFASITDLSRAWWLLLKDCAGNW